MKNAFKKGLTYFKYLSVLFSIVFWLYMIIDDWIFVEKYWDTNWLQGMGIWTLYFVAYFLAFTFYYWLTASVIILVYHKLIKHN